MMSRVESGGSATRSQEYAERLIRLQTAGWKRWLDVQAVFRWNLQRLEPGFTLDIGCGIGRTLLHLGGGGVGVDANPHCVAPQGARDHRLHAGGISASAEFNREGRFDTLLLAHVAEHMTEDDTVALLREYEPSLKRTGA